MEIRQFTVVASGERQALYSMRVLYICERVGKWEECGTDGVVGG